MAGATKPTPDEDPIPLSWQAYRQAFEVPGPASSTDDLPSVGASKRLVDALAQARDARKFEIEMYWKRAAYFWTFIAAAFVGYASFLTGSHTHAFAAFLMSLIGFVFSLAWYQVNRGSKFWQENWENHVELLEDAVTGPLFKVVAKRPKKPWTWSTVGEHVIGPRAVSVSRINGVVSVFVLVVWLELILGAAGAIFVRDVQAWVAHLSADEERLWRFGAMVALAAPAFGTAVWLLWGADSHSKSHHPDLTLRVAKPSEPPEAS